MRRALSMLLLPCFLISVLCLPGGDFALFTQLPDLYQHCKATEDPDMNFVDFITDHLINIDGVFDKHAAGDDQKPHKPFQFRYFQHITLYMPGSLLLNLAAPISEFKQLNCTSIKSYHSKYVVYIFHPPNSYFINRLLSI